MTNHLGMSDNTIEQELIKRYQIRLVNLWAEPNPYYQFPIRELTEIKQWIKKLETIIKKQTIICHT
jgi:hypothetical protein